MKRILMLLTAVLFSVALVACGDEEEVEGIPYNQIAETWQQKSEGFNHDFELGELNDENLTRIGDEANLLFGVDNPDNVTQINIISRGGYTADNIDKMTALTGVLITTLDEELTMSIDDISHIENWLINNENQDINDHSYRFDGDVSEDHYIFANINSNKE